MYLTYHMDIYKIEKPDLTNIKGSDVFKRFTENTTDVLNAINSVNEPAYFCWDKVKFKQPPKGFNSVEFWYLVKQIRTAASRKTVIQSENGEYFKWVRLNYTDEYLHKIDIQLGGQIFTHYNNLITPDNKQRLLTQSIIEEAIASSQLEGASTTAPVAKRMILENRPPRDKSEQMILNNFKTIKAIEDEYKDRELSQDMLFELHRLITHDTLEITKQGRFRTDEDEVVVADQMNYIYHIPPKEAFLKEQMGVFIKFANDENDDSFIHPIVKAILLHFWIGYLHPFCDGNGRIARTIFYWYLLRKGYWAIMYLPISLVIKKSPTQYGMAYVFSEQDDLDITYFYDYHMNKMMLALKDFNSYIERKIDENKAAEDILYSNFVLNDRQKQVLHYLILRDKNAYTTPSTHQTLYNISRTTAIADLKQLEAIGLILSKRMGKYVRYYSTDKLREQSSKK